MQKSAVVRDAATQTLARFGLCKLAWGPASTAALGAGLGGSINAVRKFWDGDDSDPIERRLVNAAKGFGVGALTGGAIGGLSGAALKRFEPVNRAMNYKPFAKVDPDEANAMLKNLANTAYAAYMHPVSRFIGGALVGRELAQGYKNLIDDWRLHQYAAEKMRHDNPNLENAESLGFALSRRHAGPYSRSYAPKQ
jgi:hypothetical protein